jgi:hypothetical protein
MEPYLIAIICKRKKKKGHEEKVQVSAIRYDSNMTKGLCYVAQSLLNQKKKTYQHFGLHTYIHL